MTNNYILVKEFDVEKYFKEIYTIVKDVEPGSWYDEHKIAESNNLFDFVASDGNWAVESKSQHILLCVQNKGKLINSSESIYFFTDYSNSLYEEQIDFIYHKDKKGNWLLVWSR